MCRALADAGFAVVVGYGRSRDKAEELAAALPGGPHLAIAADVTDSAALEAVAGRVERELGGCDVLVNAAGTTRFVLHDDLDALDDDLIDEILRTNVRGAFAAVRAFRPLLERSTRPGGGAVVNISSIAAMTGMGGNVAYCASKAALDSLTRSLGRARRGFAWSRCRPVSSTRGSSGRSIPAGARSSSRAPRSAALRRRTRSRRRCLCRPRPDVHDRERPRGGRREAARMTERTHDGRVAVVSGAARGIGRALAEGLASRGAHVVAVDVLDMGETADAIAVAGGRCEPVVADVGDKDDVARLAENVCVCDVLVNNAALLGKTPFLELDLERFRRRCASTSSPSSCWRGPSRPAWSSGDGAGSSTSRPRRS